MALKFVITNRADLDALAEPVRQLYIEKDGKFTLAVDGVVPDTEVNDLKTKLAEFRDNNRTLHSENEKFKPIVEKLKTAGIDDVTKLDAHLSEHGDLKKLKDKGIGKPDDLQAAIDAALKPIKEQLSASEQARLDAEKRANESAFKEAVQADAVKLGVRATGMRHVLREASEVFEWKDGKLVPKPGQKHPDDPLKELNPTAWLEHLQRTDAYLFEDSSGGGADNRRLGGGKPGAKILKNPSPEEMGRNMDAIAKGEMVVIRD